MNNRKSLIYKKRIYNFYIKNNDFIYLIARKIKKINQYTPLEIEDIVSFSFLKLLKDEEQLFYKVLNGDDLYLKKRYEVIC